MYRYVDLTCMWIAKSWSSPRSANLALGQSLLPVRDAALLLWYRYNNGGSCMLELWWGEARRLEARRGEGQLNKRPKTHASTRMCTWPVVPVQYVYCSTAAHQWFCVATETDPHPVCSTWIGNQNAQCTLRLLLLDLDLPVLPTSIRILRGHVYTGIISFVIRTYREVPKYNTLWKPEI